MARSSRSRRVRGSLHEVLLLLECRLAALAALLLLCPRRRGGHADKGEAASTRRAHLRAVVMNAPNTRRRVGRARAF